jgi:integrative and conjugative element protein (TIGR02256 family)
VSSHLPFHQTPVAIDAIPSRVHVSTDAFQFIQREIQQWHGVETGGVLVGYLEGEQFVITHASDPGPRGRRRRRSVQIDGAFATEFCHDLESRSGGSVYYLGDWHVHPVGSLSLSPRDRHAAKALVEAAVSPVPQILSVIFAGDGRNAKAHLCLPDGSEAELAIMLGGALSWQPPV